MMDAFTPSAEVPDSPHQKIALPPSSSKLRLGRLLKQGVWHEGLIVALGLLAAFWFGFWYAHQYPLSENFHQEWMGSALTYACTGTFGHAEPAPGWTAADQAAVQDINQFLSVRRLDYSCASFPHVRVANIFHGAAYSNEETPLYLSLIYGLAWRLFGVQWAVTYYIVGVTAALSFLAIYLCTRAFMPPLIGCCVAFAFICNPVMLTHILNPRDCLKLPFFVAVAAILIGTGTSLKTPRRFIFFACAVGLLIGLGLGFRPDMLYLLFLAAIVIGLLGQLDLSRAHRRFAGVWIRLLAVGGLIASFVVAGWLPLWNDYVARPYDKDLPFHIMAMGQLGDENYSLFQSNAPFGEAYMYRNGIVSDVPITLRVIEYALRVDGAKVSQQGGGPYWTYAKRYYLNIVRIIPADLLSRGIGAFVAIMTVPASLAQRVPPPNGFQADLPWTHAYDFAAPTSIITHLAVRLDRIYDVVGHLPFGLLFIANLLAFFLLLCFITARLGVRAMFAALVVLGAITMVSSLDFEMRHMFQLYVLPLIAWTSVIWCGGRKLLPLAVIRLGEAGRNMPIMLRLAVPPVRAVAITLGGTAAVALMVLEIARAYQVVELRGIITRMLDRNRITADYQISDLPSGPLDGHVIPPGTSKIDILSPIPLSNGGEHAPGDPMRSRGDMGVVAVEFDGQACASRTVTVTAFSASQPPPAVSGTLAYSLFETFNGRLSEPDSYVAFLPAFFYAHPNSKDYETFFRWVELPTRDVPCVKSVKVVTEFSKTDILFDFFVPENPAYLKRGDLFQRVFIPLIGFI